MIRDELQIPPSWEWVKFEGVAEIASDLTDPTELPSAFHIAPNHIESWTGKLLPYRTVADDGVTSPKHRFRPGQILYSKIRPYLAKAVIASFEGVCSADMYPINSAIDARYLHLWLLTPWFTREAAGRQGRSVLPKINREALAKLPVPVPPQPEQVRIVSAVETQFTRLDAGIGGLRQTQAKLKRYRASVLKAACEGRLIPAEAELARSEGRDYEPADRLLARILQERRERWEADQLSKMEAQGKTPKSETWKAKYQEPERPSSEGRTEVPEGWTWATVGQVSQMVQYGTSSKTSEDSGGVPVLRMGNIVDGRLSTETMKYLPEDHDEFPALLLEADDLLFNRTNSAELVGKTAIYRGVPSPCSFASYLIRVRFLDGLAPDFLAYYLNSIHGRRWVASVATQQVGQANVNGTKLQALAIPLPPTAEQTRIVAEVGRRLSLIDELDAAVTANLKRAERLRQSILKRAFEGKLVPQDPADEPAATLLERIGRTPRQPALFE